MLTKCGSREELTSNNTIYSVTAYFIGYSPVHKLQTLPVLKYYICTYILFAFGHQRDFSAVYRAELCFWAGFGSASMALRLLRWLMPKAKWKTCFAFVCARKKPRNGGRAANLAVMVTAEKKREKMPK